MASYRRPISWTDDMELPLRINSAAAIAAGLQPVSSAYDEQSSNSTCLTAYGLSVRTRRRRRFVINELVSSEHSYCSSLSMIEKEVIEPLMTQARSPTPILRSATMSAIFSNFVDLLLISSTLLDILSSRQDWHELVPDQALAPNAQTIGTVFCQIGHYLKMYRIYCRNFRNASTELEHELRTNLSFKAFVAGQLTGDGRMPLQSYLLLPVQRIPRYRLMLKDLLDCTPSTHAEYANLQAALLLVSDIALSINEAIRQHEAWQQLQTLQATIQDLDEPLTNMPSRRLLRQGDIVKICRRSHQVRTLYLFSDCLILTKYTNPSDSSSTRIFSRRIKLHEVEFKILPQQSAYQQGRPLWQVSTKEKSFIAYCPTIEESQEWISVITTAVILHCEAMTSIKTEPVVHSTINITRSKAISSNHVFGLHQLAGMLLSTTEVEYPILRGRLAPVWMEDSAAQECQLCAYPFSFFYGRHHCRICGRLVCATCSSKQFMTSTRSALFRACDTCYKDTFEDSEP